MQNDLLLLPSMTVDEFVKSWPGPVKAIVNARHGDYAIGNANLLICRSHRDMQHFRRCTMGHAVLCGSKTASSISRDWANWLHTNKPMLSGRECWVATKRFSSQGEVRNLNTSRMLWQEPSKDMVLWICGGQSLYEQCLQYCSEVQLTRTYCARQDEADAFFPGEALKRDFALTSAGPIVYTTNSSNKELYETWQRR